MISFLKKPQREKEHRGGRNVKYFQMNLISITLKSHLRF